MASRVLWNITEIKKNFYNDSHNKPNRLRIAKSCKHDCYKLRSICCYCIGTFQCIICTERMGKELRSKENAKMVSVVTYFAQTLFDVFISKIETKQLILAPKMFQ